MQLLWIGEDIQELQAYDDWLKRKSTCEFRWSGASARNIDEPDRVSAVRPNMKEDAVIRKLQQLE